MEKQYYTKQYLITVFIIGAIIGFGSSYLFDRNSDDVDEDINMELVDGNAELNKEITEDDVAVTSGENSVSVNNQPAGFRVVVGEFVLSQDGWLVVKEDINGVPGNILGAQRYNAGVYNSGIVELLRNTEEGEVYYVSIFSDDGDRKFDLSLDSEVLDKKGEPILASFDAIRIK